MSLRDTACYTLLIAPSAKDPAITEIVEAGPSSSVGRAESKGEPRYARVREKKEREVYSSAIYDYLTGAKLGSVGYEKEKSKKRRLQLHGPDEDVGFEFTGMINFEWTFTFQGNKFKWTREVYGKDYVCAMDRKPDPKVEICLAREPDKSSPGRLQILHYNIDRFPNEITDLRGLETLLVTTLMCFLDAQEERRPSPSQTPKPVSADVVPNSSLLPKPQDLERTVTPEFEEPEEPNEVIVGMTTSLDEHVARAVTLLEDPRIIFVVIRTRDTAATQRALEVSLGVTRFRHREGLSDLHQYVVDEEDKVPEPPKKGPKVINLDDAPKKAPKDSKPKWTPPKNVAIYLSTIDLPEFSAARRSASIASRKNNAVASSSASAAKPTSQKGNKGNKAHAAKPATATSTPGPAKATLQKPSKSAPMPAAAPTQPAAPPASLASQAASAIGSVMNIYQAAQARYQGATASSSTAPTAQNPTPPTPDGDAGKNQSSLGWLFKR